MSALEAHHWDALITSQAELAVVVAGALTELVMMDRAGDAMPHALRLYAAIEQAIEGVRAAIAAPKGVPA